jgi:hypothetical protein
MVTGSAAFAVLLLRRESGFTRIRVFEHTVVSMRVFLAIFTKVLESFGFDFFFTTVFKEGLGKGNLTTNVLDIS